MCVCINIYVYVRMYMHMYKIIYIYYYLLFQSHIVRSSRGSCIHIITYIYNYIYLI